MHPLRMYSRKSAEETINMEEYENSMMSLSLSTTNKLQVSIRENVKHL